MKNKKVLYFLIPLLLLVFTYIANKLGYLKKLTGFSIRDIFSKLASPEQEYFIGQLAPPVRGLVREFVRQSQSKGYTVIFTDAARTFKRQSEQKGYGNLVGNEAHEYGLGWDINLQSGTSYWRKATPTSEWESTGVPQIARNLGIRWGGDFQKPDNVHFDVKNSYDIQTLRARAVDKYGTDLASIDKTGVEFVA